MRLWGRLADALSAEQRVAMVTLVGASGSTPREAGARIVVHADGSFFGTIGGGTLEWQAIALAQAALGRQDGAAFELRSFALGPQLGQCCGGRAELAIELFDRECLGEIAALAEREADGAFATEGRIEGGRMVRRLTVDDIAPGAASWSAGILREGFGETARPLLLFGAGHVGRALVLALAPLPFAVEWVDGRPDAFPERAPGNVRPVQVADPPAALAEAPSGALVLVMTHSHELDLAIVHAALAAGRFPYVGLIGSATKRARFEHRLAEAGMDAATIGSLVCPIGVGGIGSKLPAAIAAATVAELLIRDEALRLAERGGLAARRSSR